MSKTTEQIVDSILADLVFGDFTIGEISRLPKGIAAHIRQSRIRLINAITDARIDELQGNAEGARRLGYQPLAELIDIRIAQLSAQKKEEL